MWAFRLGSIRAGVRHFAPVFGSALVAGGAWRLARCEPERDPLHDRISNRNKSYQADVPGLISAMVDPQKPHVVRVVLTGGPCGGKSSCLEHIRREVTRAGFNMLTCPEVATVIFNAGYKFDPEHRLTFQTSVAKLQLQMERNFVRLAESTGEPTIIMYDRGVLDGRAFLTDEDWSAVLNDMQREMPSETAKVIDEAYLLGRYDAVIHLVTPAALDGDGEPLMDAAGNLIYKYGATTDDNGAYVYRRENPDAARAQDARVQEVYANHRRHHVVNNKAGGMDDKIRDVVEFVMEVAEAYHPQKVDNTVIRRRIRELSRQVEKLEEAIAKR